MTPCPPKGPLEGRPLLSIEQASQVGGLFQLLANPTRLRLIHALVRSGELRVTALAEALGMSTQAVSNQLQRLADRGVVGSRREGNAILYRIVDPCARALLDLGLCLVEDAEPPGTPSPHSVVTLEGDNNGGV